jgi:hypothetical protein
MERHAQSHHTSKLKHGRKAQHGASLHQAELQLLTSFDPDINVVVQQGGVVSDAPPPDDSWTMPDAQATDSALRILPDDAATPTASVSSSSGTGAASSSSASGPVSSTSTAAGATGSVKNRLRSRNQRTTEEIVRHEAAGTEELKKEAREKRNAIKMAAAAEKQRQLEEQQQQQQQQQQPLDGQSSSEQEQATAGASTALADLVDPAADAADEEEDDTAVGHSSHSPHKHADPSADSASGVLMLALGIAMLLFMCFLLHHLRRTQRRAQTQGLAAGDAEDGTSTHAAAASDPRRPLLAGSSRR